MLHILGKDYLNPKWGAAFTTRFLIYLEKSIKDDSSPLLLHIVNDERINVWLDELRELMIEYGTFSDEVKDFIDLRSWDSEFIEEAWLSQMIRIALLIEKAKRP